MMPTPTPVPVEWLRALLQRHNTTQRDAARLLHVNDRTVRYWCAGEREMPWSAAELLRRILEESE